MTKIELSKTDFQINGISIEFPIEITILQQALGDYRYTKKKYNHTYTWDNLGIIAFSKEGNKAESLAIELELKKYDYCAKSIFTGTFIFDGQELFELYKSGKNKPIKLFKGDRSGAFILNGISVWFEKEDGKLILGIFRGIKYFPQNLHLQISKINIIN